MYDGVVQGRRTASEIIIAAYRAGESLHRYHAQTRTPLPPKPWIFHVTGEEMDRLQAAGPAPSTATPLILEVAGFRLQVEEL